MIHFTSSLQTARIIVEQVINDVRTQNIDATVFVYVDREKSFQQGVTIIDDDKDLTLCISECTKTFDINIKKTLLTSQGKEESTHNFDRDFDAAKEFIVRQLLKHSRQN